MQSAFSKLSQHSFSCMFHGCDLKFSSLQEFKCHITDGHKQQLEKQTVTPVLFNETPPKQEPADDDNDKDSNADVIEAETQEEGTVRESPVPDLEDPEDKPVNDSQLELEMTDDKNAVNALMKLCEFHHRHSTYPKPVMVETKTDVHNLLPLLSPTSDTSEPVILTGDQSSAIFYQKQQGQLNECNPVSPRSLTSPRRPLSSPSISNFVSSPIKDKRVSGRKRKLTEMSANELAHLTLRLQGRVSSLKKELEIAHKQLSAAGMAYRKKAKIARRK